MGRELDIKYVVFDSEIGYLYCYDLGDNKYKEFFTDENCHLEGTTLVFDFCNCGFDVSILARISGDTMVNVKEVDKWKFDLGTQKITCSFGSKNNVFNFILNKLDERRDKSQKRTSEELKKIYKRAINLKRETDE